MFNKLVKARNSKKGFTLIEVMVVVAIIAILAAVAIPAYLSYKREASAEVARTSFAAIIESYNAYVVLNGKPDSTELDITNASAKDVADFLASAGNAVSYDHFNADNAAVADLTEAAAGNADLLTVKGEADYTSKKDYVDLWYDLYTK